MNNLLGKLRTWWAKVTARRPHGLPAMPGASATLAGGKLPKLPKIDWEKLYRKSFVYNSVAAVICGYFAADLLVASLTPWFPPTEAPRPRNLVSERHDFGSYASVIVPAGRPHLFSEKGLVPEEEGGTNFNGPPVKTSLPLNLLGVILLRDDPKKSVASIEDKTANAVVAVRANEPITRDTVVRRILEDRVIFENNATGRLEYVELPQDTSVLSVRHAAPVKAVNGVVNEGGGHLHVENAALKTALTKNWNLILTQAHCVQNFEGGRVNGFKCGEIEPGSVYETLGLQNGDVVTQMDGTQLSDLTPLLGKLNELKEGRVQHLSITVMRNGAPVTTYIDLD